MLSPPKVYLSNRLSAIRCDTDNRRSVQVKIDGVTKTLKLVTWRGPNLGSQWNEMGDVKGVMRPVAAHRLPWHLCVPGSKFRTNGHVYEVMT